MNITVDGERRFDAYRPDGNRAPRPLLDEIDVETRMQRVEHGLGAEVFERVCGRLGLPAQRFGELIGLPAIDSDALAAVGASGLLHGAPADRLEALERVADYAFAVVDEKAVATGWFGSTVHALGGRRPADCLDSEAGRELVLDTLGAIEYGHVM